MKKIELKKVNIPADGVITAQDLDYRDTIMGLLTVPKDPQVGASFEEMLEVMPIHRKFSERPASAKFILLEDAEHKVVVDRLRGAKFNRNSIQIFEMIQSVIDAQEHLMEAKSG